MITLNNIPAAAIGFTGEGNHTIDYLNPGEDWNYNSKVFRVDFAVGNFSHSIIVEANDEAELLDILSNSEHGDRIKIKDEDLKDYITGTDTDGNPEYSCYFDGDGNALDLSNVLIANISEQFKSLFGVIQVFEKTYNPDTDIYDGDIDYKSKDEFENDYKKSFYGLKRYIENLNIEPSCSYFSDHLWYSDHDYYTDMQTGVVTERDYFLKGFHPDIERFFYGAVINQNKR